MNTTQTMISKHTQMHTCVLGVAHSHLEMYVVCIYACVDKITLHAKGSLVTLYSLHFPPNSIHTSIWSKLYTKYLCKQILTKTHWVKETKSWSGKPNHGQNKYKVTARRDPLPACVCFIWFIYSFQICVIVDLFFFNFFQSNLVHFFFLVFGLFYF